jgi:hypothetical protein
MKIALLATAAAAIALSSGAAAVVSSSAALADTVNTSVRHPFGTKIPRTDRVREYQARRAYIREHTYREHTYVPVYSRPPAVRHASEHLSDVRDRVHADGRVTLFEKIRLKAAQNRYNATVRAYR